MREVQYPQLVGGVRVHLREKFVPHFDRLEMSCFGNYTPRACHEWMIGPCLRYSHVPRLEGCSLWAMGVIVTVNDEKEVIVKGNFSVELRYQCLFKSLSLCKWVTLGGQSGFEEAQWFVNDWTMGVTRCVRLSNHARMSLHHSHHLKPKAYVLCCQCLQVAFGLNFYMTFEGECSAFLR